ncbi:MAG TPA: S8 family serine peptidase, partial [candidate division Zixibacteria bacterium]|nr:S8 family serine peptidase [candidate division Zixibacteria bacterium]
LAVRDAINYAKSNGVIVVAAAGNAASDAITYPAAEVAALAVSAVDTADSRAEFANYGDFVDVYAPGTNIYSAFESGERAWWSGTSFSTPFVSGQIAGLLQLRPGASIEDLKDAVTRSADKPHPTTPDGGVIDLLGSFTRIMDTLRAHVSPDTISLTHEQGKLYIINPRATVMVSSDNAPAPYTVEIAPGADPLVCPQEAVGVTNDSLVFDFCNFEGLAPGEYFNTVLFHVDGITYPAELAVKVTIVEADTIGTHYASVTPDTISFTHVQGAEYFVAPWGAAYLVSDNAPAVYSAELVPSAVTIACPRESGGMTNDTVVIDYCYFDSLAIGDYYNTILFHVDGVVDPAELTVKLTVVEGDTSGTPIANVIPSSLILSAPVTSSNVFYASAVLSSSNSPAVYTGFMLAGGAGFATLVDSVGVTPDSVRLRIDHSALTAPGIYNDTALFEIEGVPGVTLLGITLTLTGDTVVAGDSAVVTPSISFLTVPHGIDTSHQMTLTVSA